MDSLIASGEVVKLADIEGHDLATCLLWLSGEKGDCTRVEMVTPPGTFSIRDELVITIQVKPAARIPILAK